MRHFYRYILFSLIIFIHLPEVNAQNIKKLPILLENWKIRIINSNNKLELNKIIQEQSNTKKFQTIKAINWEADISQGGISAKKHNGYAIYKTSFYVDEQFKKISLALFIKCIDDVSKVFLNNSYIGQNGIFPNELKKRNINFHSGVRNPEMHILPNQLLKYNQKNSIKIIFYDFAGSGGFCYKQIPKIDLYKKIKIIHTQAVFENNAPRIILIAILISLIFIRFKQHVKLFFNFQFHICAIKYYLNNMTFSQNLFHPKKCKFILSNTNNKIAFKNFLLIHIYIFYILFLSSELPYKYLWIESETFWFKYPPVFALLSVAFTQIVFHADVFGKFSIKMKNKKYISKSIKILLFLITHPIITFLFIIYHLSLPAEKAWTCFSTNGIFFLIGLTSLLFGYTAINLFFYYFKISKEESKTLFIEKTIFLKEGIIRGLTFISLFLGIIIFTSHSSLSVHSFLIAISFLSFFLYLSQIFYEKNHIELPLSISNKISIEDFLKDQYMLTNQEITICREFNLGKTRREISQNFSLTDNAIKFHLRNIYAKTINLESSQDEMNQKNKLPRLLNLLKNIEKKLNK